MIEDMEDELTESPTKTSNTDNSAVVKEANIDEAITSESKASNKMEIHLKEEQRTQAYNKTLNIDIENINKFEKINKVYTTPWRKIYEVIEPEFFEKSDIFPDDF